MGEGESSYKYLFPNKYKSKSFWARPDKSQDGVPDPRVIYMSAGHALSNWEHVEMSMAMLFGVFVDSLSTAASRAYGSINSSRGKANAIREAGRTFFSIRRNTADQKDRAFINQVDQFTGFFELFLDNYRTASARRADIAHGMAYDFVEDVEQPERSWLLIPPPYQASHRGDIWVADDVKLRQRKGLKMGQAEARSNFLKMTIKNSEYVYGVGDLKVFAGKFAFFSMDILAFVKIFGPDRVTATREQLTTVAEAMSGKAWK